MNQKLPPNPVIAELKAIRLYTGALALMVFIAMLPVWLLFAALILGYMTMPSSY